MMAEMQKIDGQLKDLHIRIKNTLRIFETHFGVVSEAVQRYKGLKKENFVACKVIAESSRKASKPRKAGCSHV